MSASIPLPGPVSFGAQLLDSRTDHPRVAVSGEIDLTTAPRLGRVLTEAGTSGSGPVEVDLSDVSFCDASGVNALVGARNRLRAAGRPLVLINVPARVARVLLLAAAGQLLDQAG